MKLTMVLLEQLHYADDLTLLSSLIGIQDMLNVYTKELNAMGLKLNIDKCVAIITGKYTGKVKNLLLYDNVFKGDTELRSFGIMFNAGVKLKFDVAERSRKFIGSVASVLRGRVMGEEIKCLCS